MLLSIYKAIKFSVNVQFFDKFKESIGMGGKMDEAKRYEFETIYLK